LVLAVLAAAAAAATRPHYGGTLRVETRVAAEIPDPPQTGPDLARLADSFAITRWEAGRRAVYAANANAPGGRPFLDQVEVTMGRSLRDQSIDLETGRADIVEVGPGEMRRQPAGRRLWISQPVRLLALVFSERVGDPRLREALAAAVDRAAIHAVLLQRQGEPTGALLPQWLSGYAFVFPAAADPARARALVSALPAAARTVTLGAEDPAARPIVERIALNARDAGLAASVAPWQSADVRLVEVRIASADPSLALAGVAAALGLPEPPRAATPEALYAAESALLEGWRVVPLFHLPLIYAAGPRVRGGPAITPLGEWTFERLWLDEGRP
jgi:ABC-type transport system substrate-binding protein